MPRKSNTSVEQTAAAPVAPATAPVAPATTTVAPATAPTTTPQEDQALRNINYKNMLLTGNYGMIKPDVVTHPNIDAILENEKNTNKSEPWNKLDKSSKVIKLREFSTRHGKEHELTEREITALYQFLVANLEQKKLARAKDVVYDKVTGLVTSIPCLLFNAALKKFTLKRCEKRQSTLKSLAPTGMSKKRRLTAAGEGGSPAAGASGAGSGDDSDSDE